MSFSIVLFRLSTLCTHIQLSTQAPWEIFNILLDGQNVSHVELGPFTRTPLRRDDAVMSAENHIDSGGEGTCLLLITRSK